MALLATKPLQQEEPAEGGRGIIGLFPLLFFGLLLSFACSLGMTHQAHAWTLSDAEGANNHAFTVTFDKDEGALTLKASSLKKYTATFSDGEAIDSVLTIPETYEGVDVKKFTLTSSVAVSYITSLELPAGITSIGSIMLRDDIATTSFADNGVELRSIEGVIYGKEFNPQTIDGVYYECVIPEGVTSIAVRAFAYYADYDDGFSSIYVPSTLTEVTGSATDSYNADGTISTPGDVVFWRLSALTTFRNESPIWFSLGNCPNVTSYSYAGSSTEMPTWAYYGWSSLDAAYLPDGITSIPRGAFGYSGLTSFVVPSTVTSIGEQAFAGSGLTSFVVPATVTSIGERAFVDCASLQSLEIPEGCSFDYNLKGCASLQSVTIPDGVTDLSAASLQGCASLTKFEVPNSVTAVASDFFVGCSSLEEVVLSDNLTELPSFADCASLKRVVIPSSVTSISSFKNCAALESVEFAGNELLETVPSNAFQGTEQLKTLVIPDSVTLIRSGAFNGSSIESIVLPASLWAGMSFSDENSDFNKDPSGMDIRDTTGQTGHIAYGAQLFVYVGVQYLVDTDNWNTSLKSVDLSKYSQDTIPYYMFAGCSALEEVRIPSVVRTLKEGAFADCVSLQRVYLYNADPQVAGAASSADTGDGSGGSGEGGWTEHYPSAFGNHLMASADAINDANGRIDGKAPDGVTSIADYYGVNTDMVLYGVGFKQNSLLQYAEKYDCTFVPFAFLGDGGSSAEVLELFGYEMPANTVSVADIKAGETPVFTLTYQDEEVTRTLEPGVDCTVKYYDANGVPTDNLTVGGTYTAVITGDSDSVWGTTTVSFNVDGPAVSAVESADSDGTGIAATGSLIVPDYALDDVLVDGVDADDLNKVLTIGQTDVASDEYGMIVSKAYDQAKILGVYDVALFVGVGDTADEVVRNGVEVHEKFGYLDLTFPVDEQWNGYYVYVHHLHSNGSISTEKVAAADGKVTVRVTDLSTFMLELGDKVPVAGESTEQNPPTQTVSAGQEPAAPVTPVALAQTGDSAAALPPVVAALAAAAALVAALAFACARKGSFAAGR